MAGATYRMVEVESTDEASKAVKEGETLFSLTRTGPKFMAIIRKAVEESDEESEDGEEED